MSLSVTVELSAEAAFAMRQCAWAALRHHYFRLALEQAIRFNQGIADANRRRQPLSVVVGGIGCLLALHSRRSKREC